MSKKLIIIALITAAIIIPIGVYTASSLFTNTIVDEPLPIADTSEGIQKFISMNEEEKMQAAKQMTEKEENQIMNAAAQINNSVDENVTATGKQQIDKELSGNFVGVNDGIHNAAGIAKVISLQQGSNILRLENFKATNGPDLYVYLGTDKSASDFVSLGRLKDNIGNQNYDIPGGTDLSKYNTVLIWCRAFSVLFGSAQLTMA
jgi:Electron transfer DM13